jgi:predicted exporter
VAVCVTRWVLPAMLPERFAGVRQSGGMMRVATIASGGRRLRPLVAILTVAAAASLALGHGAFWAGELSSLSPVPAAEQRLDQLLRRDMRATDASTLIVIRKRDEQAVLEVAEHVTALLGAALPQGAAVDSPAWYQPSEATQRVRQAALPDAATLQIRLDAALDGLPFQPNLFAPFVADVTRQRSLAPVTHADLNGTALALKLDSLLLHQRDGWIVTLSLRDAAAPETVAKAIADEPDAVLVDLKAESNRLLRVYLGEGISLASLGAGGIALLLLVSLRSWRRLAMVIAPLAAAVVVTFAVLRLGGHALSIFNLFGVLLVVAIGSNYCLFLDRQRTHPEGMPRVLASLLLANGCTVMGFGVLALSHTPVLHDLGMPVAIGTFLSLIFATIIMSPTQSPHAPSR